MTLDGYLTTANEIECPESDGLTYVSPDKKDRFFKLTCGADYNSIDGAKELTSVTTDTLGECIDACSARPTCVGAGWGNFYGLDTCFMKTKLGKPNDSPSWYFVSEVATNASAA